MNDVEKAAGVESSEAVRSLASTFPLRWLERGLPPSLRGEHGVEERTGWIRANIAEDRALHIPSRAGAQESRLRRLDLMRKRYPPL